MVTLLPPCKRSYGKVMFLHLSVILFTGGGSAQPPGCRPPLDSDPPPMQTLLDADPPGCGPPNADSPSPGRIQHPPPPRYMGYYGIRPTDGRYASYWNAFLLNETTSFLIKNAFQSIASVMIIMVSVPVLLSGCVNRPS